MSAAGRLEVLTDNDARLKKLLAGAMLRNAMLKESTAKNGDARREAAGCDSPLLKFLKSSQRRACAVIGVDRTSVRYRSVRPDDVAIRARLRELAISRRRFYLRKYRPSRYLLWAESCDH